MTRIGYPVITGGMASISAFTDSLNDKGLSAIVGFKLSDFFSGDDYADANKWGQIASLARELSDKTGGRPIILENEGATSNGVDVIFYPGYGDLKNNVITNAWAERIGCNIHR